MAFTKGKYINMTLNSKALAFIIAFVLFITPAWTAITNQTAVLSNDVAGNGIAAIGDTITFSCRSTTMQPDEFPYVDLSILGNAYFPLVNIAGNFYSAILTVSPGSVRDQTPRQFMFVDEGGPRWGGNIIINNQRPNSLQGPQISGATGPGGRFRVGDNLHIYIAMSTPFDQDIPRANLTSIGLGPNHTMARVTGTPDTAPEYELSIPFPMNQEGDATAITITATDIAGNSRTWDASVSYDTIPPMIESVIATNLTTGKQWVTSGDTIRIQATISNWDNDIVRVYNDDLFPPEGHLMSRVSGNVPGESAVYEYDYHVTSTPPLTTNAAFFTVRATDDVGNESNPRVSNPLMFDNIPPEFDYPFGIRIIENNPVYADNIAIIGDQLHIYGNLASIMSDVTVTVDLSSIGGVANQIVPFNGSATTTFELYYDVHQYNSRPSTPRTFTVRAVDPAENEISRITLPVIYVDNTPPRLSAGQFLNVSRPGNPVRRGDTIAISANVVDVNSGNDDGEVWVNLERIGGSDRTTLSPYSGNTWRVEHVVGDPINSTAPYSGQSVSFTIHAQDSSGNRDQTLTNTVLVNNDVPNIVAAGYQLDGVDVTPPFTSSDPWAKIGDLITFWVELEEDDNDVDVYINLTEFGDASPRKMIKTGAARYRLTVEIPSGNINNVHYFSFYAEDDFGNRDNGVIEVKIDNKPPDVGPMGVNWLTDVPEAGIINIGDILEFIVPVDNPDGGSATIDLTLVGGDSATIMTYHAPLRRYYLVHDAQESAMTHPSHVFTAVVRDKAGNRMNSLSDVFDVNCRPPVINDVWVEHISNFGKPDVVNVGDTIIITADVPLSLIDGGIPRVDLSKLGGNANQEMFDDGAHQDGHANDGIFGYVHTVTEGNTDGENISLTVRVTDRAGNRATKSSAPIFVDNKPLVITSCTVTQIFDNNNNGIVDLDGVYTTFPSVATDVVRIQVDIEGSTGDLDVTDPDVLTVDLTALGINDTTYPIPVAPRTGGWRGRLDISPLKGNTDREEVSFTVTLRDVNGNVVTQETSNSVIVDNQPPKLEVYPLSFVVDEGIVGEANLGDVLQIRVRVTGNDPEPGESHGILPQVDFTNLFLANGLTPPSPVFMPPNPNVANEHIYEFTVPEGLGTVGSFTILAYDLSGNMVYGYTNEVRFLSRTPIIEGYPKTRAELSKDVIPLGGNRIANPANIRDTVPDEVTITAVLSSAYNTLNDPPARVVADIGTIQNPTATPFYDDGNPETFWAQLDYQAAISGPGNHVYRKTFEVFAAGIEHDIASFGVMVLHPDVISIPMASSTIRCNPSNPFGIDTEIPFVRSVSMDLVDDFGDNPDPYIMNIGDLIEVSADIRDFPDPGSVTAIIYTHANEEIMRLRLSNEFNTTNWRGNFEIKEHRPGGWPKLDGTRRLNYRVAVTDDADNYHHRTGQSDFNVKNTKPEILAAELIIDNPGPYGINDEQWLVNVGYGQYPDGIIASLTLTDSADLGWAYVDFSPIGGTSTYELDNELWGPSATLFTSQPFIASATGYELATRTFRIWAFDPAGNSTFIDKQMAVDTERPRVLNATYDGVVLRIEFSEPVRPEIDVEMIRIGSRMDHGSLISDRVIHLNPYDPAEPEIEDMVINTQPSSIVNIVLSPLTKGRIADWGPTNLYLSMSRPDSEWPPASPVALDRAGNWMVQLPRTPATFTIDVTADYTERPQLVGATYDASSNVSRQYMDLFFDGDMEISTINASTLEELAIWRDRGNALDTFLNRYRFAIAANDDVNEADSTLNRIRINLSQEAQDWIAINYGRTATEFRLAIRGSAYEPPPSTHVPLIRDMNGNRVLPIDYNNATAATLVPLNTQFSIQGASMDLTGSFPVLQINFDSIRRARLYRDSYKNLSDTIERSRDLPIDLSEVYLYATADMNNSLPLNQNMVDYSEYEGLNPDYASTTIRIPLTNQALQTMLTWGTSRFYIACNDGAFRDLWNNTNIRYPLESNQAQEIAVTFPDAATLIDPKIQSIAISPANTMLDQGLLLFKGQQPGNLFYEVAFETATLTPDVYIPIDRTRTPELRLYTQSDLSSPKDTANFVNWTEHNQGGRIRTVAVFRNNSDLESSANLQREPVLIQLRNFTDIFNSTTSFEDNASYAYNLADKDTSILGFKNASYPALIDNRPPEVAQVIPTGTIGITPANGMDFYVTFDERMDRRFESTYHPQLRLGDSSTTVMSFAFSGWSNNYTARFTNSRAFDESTIQGTATYYISGGYDEAGNRGANDVNTGFQAYVRSKGPNIQSYRVETYPSTTAKFTSPTGNVIDKPFSPYVPPGVATITVTFENFRPGSEFWLHIYQGESSLASMPITVSALEGKATWDGTLNGAPIGRTGPTTYQLRVYDDGGNEGSRRGQIVYDGQEPKVSYWNFGNVRIFDGKAYFSPNVQSFVKVELFGPSAGDTLRMRLVNPGLSTDTYPITGMAGGGYTISFDGRDSNVPAGTLVDGEYMVNVVDPAGNIGTPLGANSQATGTLVIDRTAPLISSIQTFRENTGEPVNRINPRVSDLRIEVSSIDPTVASGTALVRIMVGSSLIREIPLQGAASPYYANWDGRDKDLQYVEDGTYEISVIDLAGNAATGVTRDISVVTSLFKVTDVRQINKNTVRMTFSHDVDEDGASLPSNYTLSPATPAGIGAGSPINVEGNVVTIPLTQTLRHGETYTLSVPEGYRSAEDMGILSGNNSGQFTADTQGPRMVMVTYDGINQQNQFNVVFDEELESVSAQNVGLYTLLHEGDTIAIEDIALRADLQSVRITTFDRIIENETYTIIASGVKDLFGNPSDGDEARLTFVAHDITPPVLDISAFSNPANEFDISVVVKADKDLSGAPTATITQSGATAVSIILNAGPNNRMFIGGTHLNMNYPGVVTIDVEGMDTSGNVGESSMSFTTAFVNASIRASVRSPDEVFEAVFEPGSLKSDSMVALMPEELVKVEIQDRNNKRLNIILPSTISELNHDQAMSLRASSVGSGLSADELEPVGSGYTLNLPAGRIKKPVKLRFNLSEEQLEKDVGLYRNDISGFWRAVDYEIVDNQAVFKADAPGTFAMMRDRVAPRVNLLTSVREDEPIRESRPSFVWKVEDYGSGVDYRTAWVTLDDRRKTIVVDNETGAAWFVPEEDLPNGEYELVFGISDKAGNARVSDPVRFQLIPDLVIYEVTQYPNPASRQVNIRIGTNRSDLDWDHIDVKIYDTAGHLVVDSNHLTIRPQASGNRRVHDVVWNLRASGGRMVANGVYFARITVRDPDDFNKRSRYTHKIAVLR